MYISKFYSFRTDGKISRALSDIAAAHRRRWPDRQISLTSRLWLLASSPGLQFMLMYRINNGLLSMRGTGLVRKWFRRIMLIALMPLTMAIKINSKSDIANGTEIDGGVCLSDQGNNIFGARNIGTGTVIGARVTVGRSHVDGGRPDIGRNVWIGSDCVVYGAISIGDGATLLPGTVLTKSIPAGSVMQGNPARLVLRNFDNSLLRAHRNVDAMQYVNTMKEG